MNDHQIKLNQLFWNRRKALYPFHVERARDTRIRPENIEDVVSDHILYVPVGDVIYWGFKNDADRKKFMNMHGGKVIV